MGKGLVKSSSNYIKNWDKDAMVLGKQIFRPACYINMLKFKIFLSPALAHLVSVHTLPKAIRSWFQFIAMNLSTTCIGPTLETHWIEDFILFVTYLSLA